MQTVSEKSKERIINVVPNIDLISLSNTEWQDLDTRIQKDLVKTKSKRMTQSLVLHHLSLVSPEKYNALLLNKKRKFPRAAHHETLTIKSEVRAVKRRKKAADYAQNTFIFEKTHTVDDKLLENLASKGVRIVDNLDPTSPDARHKHVKQTPGKTKVKCVFQNNYGCFFKPDTPPGTTQTQGRMILNSNNKVNRKLTFERAEPVQTTITYDKMLHSQGKKRTRSQNQLTGMTCKAFFLDQGFEVEKGNHCHWSHEYALFLGGKHAISNLFPATAVANLNTLKVVEMPIAKRLPEVDIYTQINLNYLMGESIPENVEYQLKWGPHFFENIVIDTQSYRPINRAELESIETLRAGCNRSLSG